MAGQFPCHWSTWNGRYLKLEKIVWDRVFEHGAYLAKDAQTEPGNGPVLQEGLHYEPIKNSALLLTIHLPDAYTTLTRNSFRLRCECGRRRIQFFEEKARECRFAALRRSEKTPFAPRTTRVQPSPLKGTCFPTVEGTAQGQKRRRDGDP